MWHNITRYGNNITVNSLSEESIYLYLYKEVSCDDVYEEIISKTSITNHTFTLPIEDGIYKLILRKDENTAKEIFIPHYQNFLVSLTDDIDYILCGCGCSDCPDCDGNDMDVLSVILKILSYTIINKEKYINSLIKTNSCIECDILEINECNLLLESVVGNIENMALLKKIVAYYYLVFYYTDLQIIQNEEFVKQLYQFSKILPCVKKYISNKECISNIITSYNNYDIAMIENKLNNIENKLDIVLNKLASIETQNTKIYAKFSTVYEWIADVYSGNYDKGSVVNKTPENGAYPSGTNVTAKAQPNSGYLFDKWVDMYGQEVSIENPYNSILPTHAIKIFATFKQSLAGQYPPYQDVVIDGCVGDTQDELITRASNAVAVADDSIVAGVRDILGNLSTNSPGIYSVTFAIRYTDGSYAEVDVEFRITNCAT